MRKQVAKDLKHDRIHRESGISTPADSVSGRESQVSGEHAQGDDDDDMDDLELKSIHSLDTRTFITEPKIGARVKVGRDALNEKSDIFYISNGTAVLYIVWENRHKERGSNERD